MGTNKGFFGQLVLCFILIFIPSLVLNDIMVSLKLTASFLFFIFLPFLPLIEKIEGLKTVEKFILNILLGLSYAGIYVILDVIFKVPLTKTVYLIATGIIIIFNWGIYLKNTKLANRI